MEKSITNLIKNISTKVANKNIIDLKATAAKLRSEAKVTIQPFRLHRLDEGPPTNTVLTRHDALQMYNNLFTIRKLELAACEMYKAKLIAGYCHLYIGQEAVAVGMRAAMRPTDSAVTAYRCHGWAHLMGVSLAGVLSELAGRVTGCSRGKGGSMHMFAPKFYGGHGINGAQVPMGTGVGLAHKYKGDGGISFILYGDDVANKGQLFESFNIAKLWKLPCVYVCENNRYGWGTSTERTAVNTKYYTRGDVVPGLWVDGTNVLAVREATRFAAAYCRKGYGPILLEPETYRYCGPSMPNTVYTYRTLDELRRIHQMRDPLKILKDIVITNLLASAEELTNIEKNVTKLMDEACEVAMTAEATPPAELTADVYVRALDAHVRGTTPDRRHPHYQIAPRYAPEPRITLPLNKDKDPISS